MDIEEKRRYIERVYKDALAKGLCRNQKQFAEAVCMNQSTISQALKGSEKYLTDRMVLNVTRWADLVGLYATEKPEALVPGSLVELYLKMAETIRVQAETIARLQGIR